MQAYPMVGGIILGELDFKKYTGKRFPYEWDCCWLGWSLAQLNPTLLEQKGLLQRATDNVASFVFEGCMSRTKLKSHRNEKNKSRDSALPLHDWEKHMLPRPEWLPGLDQDKKQKERLKKLFDQTKAEYHRHNPKGDQTIADKATQEAINFYAQRVNGEAMSTTTSEKAKVKEIEKKNNNAESSSSMMNYINIPADPHVDSKDAAQIRINVLLDRVRENVISDSVRLEGTVFIDVFETSGIADNDLKTKIDEKIKMVDHYRNHDIGLVRPGGDDLMNFVELIKMCGLDVDEYNIYWEDFKLEMNGLGFKIVSFSSEATDEQKYLDTNNRHQKITDPLLMQRVLHEIMRRSLDSSERYSKKRKSDAKEPRDDGMYAEESFNRETRGARPGMADWLHNIKRRRTDSSLSGARRMYKSG
jgi:hypothetical protein